MPSWDEGRDWYGLVPESSGLGGGERMWHMGEMAGMAGRLVTLSNLIKPVRNCIEDNDRFLTVAEGIYKHRKVGQLEKTLRHWIEIGHIGLSLHFKM